jgi:hypothetical protein
MPWMLRVRPGSVKWASLSVPSRTGGGVMPDHVAADLAAATIALEKTAASLQRHIEAEGLKIGAVFGKNHAQSADERIKAKDVELQRQTDLVAELFRQRKPLERHSDRYGQIVRAVRAARNAGETTISVDWLLGVINAPYEPAAATMTDTTATTGATT